MTEPITKEERARIINGEMPSRFCFPGAAGIVHAWVLSQAYEARLQELEAALTAIVSSAVSDGFDPADGHDIGDFTGWPIPGDLIEAARRALGE